MSDNISKYQFSQVEFEIASDNIVGFDNPPIFEVIVTFENPILIEVISENNTPPKRKIKKWTLALVKQYGAEIHGKKFNYSLVREEHVAGSRSKIPVFCNICGYDFTPAIQDHLGTKPTGCSGCVGRIPWNLERFLIRARKIHVNKYDYSRITEEHIKNKDSPVPIICITCKYEWSPSIHSHVNGKNCPDCVDRAPWNLERFLQKAEEIHGIIFDYSQITEEHITGNLSRVPITCNICDHPWSPTIHLHINGKYGCPKCNFSKGELKCSQILDFLSVSYECEYTLSSLPGKRYDFMFMFNDKNYILEYDGQQHFIEVSHFSDTLEKRQERDLLKTKIALQEGYLMIRIDYTQIDNIQYHICKAVQDNNPIYYSNVELYSYIIDNL